MEKETLESMLIDYIDGKLDDADRARVEKEIAQHSDSYKMYEQMREVMQAMDHTRKLEPESRLRNAFDEMLQGEINRGKKSKTIFFQPVFYRAAAAIALVVGGVAIGYWINQNQQRESELLALQKEVETTKQMMLMMLDNQQSASQRMIGTTVANKMSAPDDEIVRALVKTLNEDQNTNVRLAALEALVKFYDEPQVRRELIQSLGLQKDPVIQISLIQLMVRMKEKEVTDQLQKIADDNHSIKAVKDQAYAGILKLS